MVTPELLVTPLGAGQDVGRSCLMLQMGGKTIMLDCGMHMGFQDERRYPDFSYIGEGDLTKMIDCVIITHFHLDHCGALPYLTEMVGYSGPIYMTHPTKAISPLLLEDMRKVTMEFKGDQNIFTSMMIKDCMKKVTAINLHQVIEIEPDFEIKAYYAGHVLGAAMFHVRVGERSMVYTGDYNMTPDRHLGAAWIDRCRPDLLITESTYATTIRDSKRCRERDLLRKVHDSIEKGGKVLIPVFAVGRAQELCILLETYWERMNLKVPIYFAVGLTEKANNYYKMFITWTNEKIRMTFVQRNMFDFKHIKLFDKSFADNPGPMVVFATPGMLHGGLALGLFKKWAPNETNMVIMPGYCVQGTVGHKIVNGAKRVEIDGQWIDVKLQVQYMSFSAHADAKGIMQLIQHCEPRNVMLVHGEGEKMEFLKRKIEEEFKLPVYKPANGETAVVTIQPTLVATISVNLLKRTLMTHRASEFVYDGGNEKERPIEALEPGEEDDSDFETNHDIGEARSRPVGDEDLTPTAKKPHLLRGVMVIKDENMCLLENEKACSEAGIKPHQLRFTSSAYVKAPIAVNTLLGKVHNLLSQHVKSSLLNMTGNCITINSTSILVRILDGTEAVGVKTVVVSWAYEDESLGSTIMGSLKNFTAALKT
ncbi:unnamed protein product [Notodromas monacha]|uniref:Integrator complex subunit 11 n=1 Tax=Notodromas monacha TaxID=399045 RepID=A0A7R9GD63_9CRUS|nr:unnamed protein product [Notodromas monacha]CAG0916594.1 unnamed protein product [Notodromas monacha]